MFTICSVFIGHELTEQRRRKTVLVRLGKGLSPTFSAPGLGFGTDNLLLSDGDSNFLLADGTSLLLIAGA
jgi:hypothetical protein